MEETFAVVIRLYELCKTYKKYSQPRQKYAHAAQKKRRAHIIDCYHTFPLDVMHPSYHYFRLAGSPDNNNDAAVTCSLASVSNVCS